MRAKPAAAALLEALYQPTASFLHARGVGPLAGRFFR